MAANFLKNKGTIGCEAPAVSTVGTKFGKLDVLKTAFRVSRGTCWKEKTRKLHFQKLFRTSRKSFQTLSKKTSPGLSKLESTSLEEHFEKNLRKKICFLLYFWRKISGRVVITGFYLSIFFLVQYFFRAFSGKC